MNQDTLQRLKYIIANELDVNLTIEEINVDVTLFEDGVGLDSVTVMEFISLVERDFGIQFTDEELNPETFQSLNFLADFVTKKLKGFPTNELHKKPSCCSCS